jgi:adenylate cyclase
VVFVDVRGFTALAKRLPPTEVVALLNGFYKVAADVVFGLDGTLDKLVGDEIMAFFGAPFRPEEHARRAVKAAVDIGYGVTALTDGAEALQVGGGVGTGVAYVGNVGGGEVRDFTVIGDAVNTAARLQAAAKAGEVLVMEQTYESVADQYPEAAQRTMELKGKQERVAVRVLEAWS